MFCFRVNFLCWLLFWYSFYPCITTTVCERPQLFCLGHRWQVTAKHAAFTLRVCACRLPLCKEAGHLHWTRWRRRNRIVLTYWTEHLFRARHAIWTSALRRALSLVCTFWHSLVIQMVVETHNAQGFHWCLYKQAVSVLGDTWELLPFHGGDCFATRVTSLPWWWLLSQPCCVIVGGSSK